MLAGSSFRATNMIKTIAGGIDSAKMRLAKLVSFSISKSLLRRL